MTTSETRFLSNLLPGNKPAQFVVGYLTSTLMENVHDEMLSEFLEQEETNEISKSVLALRIEKDPALITRWLSGPSNLTLETIGTLLAGMGCELEVRVVKVKSAVEELQGALEVNPIPGETKVNPGLERESPFVQSKKQAGSAQGHETEDAFRIAA